MKAIRILCVGKIKETYFNEGLAYYLKEIRKSFPIDVVECADEPTPERASLAQEQEIKRLEGQRILQKIKDDDHVIALSIDGRHYDTEHFISHMHRRMEACQGKLLFVIGGSLGLSPEVIRRANEEISFSEMTFPHQMMRMILCEQLSRLNQGK